MRLILVASVLVTAVSCTYRPAAIPIVGDSASMASLTGHWLGEYKGNESGRTGSIVFTLHAKGDSATGDVLMDEKISNVVNPADNRPDHVPRVSSPQMLFIRFVAVKGGDVSGRLDPYIAPDCDCTVTTVFTGRVRADTVEGNFFTEARMIVAQHGTWRVVRRP